MRKEQVARGLRVRKPTSETCSALESYRDSAIAGRLGTLTGELKTKSSDRRSLGRTMYDAEVLFDDRPQRTEWVALNRLYVLDDQSILKPA